MAKKTKKQKKQLRRFITFGLFVIFSSVLFFNNMSQILQNTTTLSYLQLNIIAWTGIGGSLLYALWKKAGGDL